MTQFKIIIFVRMIFNFEKYIYLGKYLPTITLFYYVVLDKEKSVLRNCILYDILEIGKTNFLLC